MSRSLLRPFAALGALTLFLALFLPVAAAQQGYADVVVIGSDVTFANGQVNATIQLDDQFEPGTEVTLTASDGSTETAVVPEDRTLELVLPADFLGTVAVSGFGALGVIVTGTVELAAVAGVVTTPTAVVVSTTIPAVAATSTPVPAAGVVVAIVDPVPCGGPISGDVSGGAGPYTVTITTNVGAASTTLAGPGGFSFAIPTGASGSYTYAVTDGNGSMANGSYALPAMGCAGAVSVGGSTATNTTTSTAFGTTTGSTGQTTVDYGFGSSTSVTAAPIAITGVNTLVPIFLGGGLLALGAAALITARRQDAN